MITKKTLGLAEAEMVIEAVKAKSEELGVAHVICVADDAGYPIAVKRMDGGKVTSVQIAENKAFTAAGHRRQTHTFTMKVVGLKVNSSAEADATWKLFVSSIVASTVTSEILDTPEKSPVKVTSYWPVATSTTPTLVVTSPPKESTDAGMFSASIDANPRT